MNTQRFLRTTALVSPIMAFALTPSVGFADLQIVETDSIQITQSADTKDSLSNTASVTLDGDVTSIMAVGGSGNIAQAGDGNSAEFVVDGRSKLDPVLISKHYRGEAPFTNTPGGKRKTRKGRKNKSKIKRRNSRKNKR